MPVGRYTYKDAAYEVLANRGLYAGVGQFVEARAFDAMYPGKVAVTGGGAAMWTSPSGDFSTDYLQLPKTPVFPETYPGFYFRSPFNWWDEDFDGTVNKNAVNTLLSEWTYSDLKKIIGPDNYDFVNALRKLYLNKVKGKGILTDTEEKLVSNALDYGMLVFFIKRKGEGNEQWNALADEWKKITDLYTKKAIAAGKEAIADSEAAVARWEAIYSFTKKVAELPSTIVTTVAKGTGFIGWQLFKANPLLMIGAAAVLFVLFAPKIAAAVGMAKGAAKRAKSVADAVKG